MIDDADDDHDGDQVGDGNGHDRGNDSGRAGSSTDHQGAEPNNQQGNHHLQPQGNGERSRSRSRSPNFIRRYLQDQDERSPAPTEEFVPDTAAYTSSDLYQLRSLLTAEAMPMRETGPQEGTPTTEGPITPTEAWSADRRWTRPERAENLGTVTQERRNLKGFMLGQAAAAMASLQIKREARDGLQQGFCGNYYRRKVATFLTGHLFSQWGCLPAPKTLAHVRDRAPPEKLAANCLPQLRETLTPDQALPLENQRSMDPRSPEGELDGGTLMAPKVWSREELQATLWNQSPVLTYLWKFAVHINGLGASVILQALKRRARAALQLGTRYLHLGDRFIAVTVFSKSELSSPKLDRDRDRRFLCTAYLLPADAKAHSVGPEPSRWRQPIMTIKRRPAAGCSPEVAAQVAGTRLRQLRNREVERQKVLDSCERLIPSSWQGDVQAVLLRIHRARERKKALPSHPLSLLQ